jgi:hypothetical protein
VQITLTPSSKYPFMQIHEGALNVLNAAAEHSVQTGRDVQAVHLGLQASIALDKLHPHIPFVVLSKYPLEQGQVEPDRAR